LDRHSDYLRAALQQDRRPLGLFVGAGAPMAVRPGGEPLIPDIAGLTAEVRERLEGEPAQVIRAAFDHIDNPGGRPATVEHLLDYLRRLAAVPGDEPIRGFTGEQLAGADAAVCAAIRARLDVELPGDDTPYRAVALWCRAAIRHAPVEFFTTNYDLLLEQALERENAPYFDGFAGSYRPAFDLHAVEEDRLPDRWARLWKIHGSVNWTLSGTGSVIRAASADPSERTLIYPSYQKYDQSRRLPYLALLDRLRLFLRQSSAVLVSVGFAYRDEHINDAIAQALNANPTGSVQALLYGPLSDYPEARTLAEAAPNLSLLARDAAVVGTRAQPWASAGAAAECGFGDFAEFGGLLLDLVGRAATPPPDQPPP